MAATISNKGWVVIPAELRKKYNLTPGKAVHIIDYGGVLALVPALDDPIQQAAGMLADKEPSSHQKPAEEFGEPPKRSLLDALLEEHRQELSHD